MVGLFFLSEPKLTPGVAFSERQRGTAWPTMIYKKRLTAYWMN